MDTDFVTNQKLRLLQKRERYRGWAAAPSAAPANWPEKIRKGIPFIEAALARIAQGTYGVCVDCEESIALARLEAVPGAIRCRDCQTIQET